MVIWTIGQFRTPYNTNNASNWILRRTTPKWKIFSKNIVKSIYSLLFALTIRGPISGKGVIFPSILDY